MRTASKGTATAETSAPRRPLLRRHLLRKSLLSLLALLALQTTIVAAICRTVLWPQYEALQVRNACLDAARTVAGVQAELDFLNLVAADLVDKPWIGRFMTGGLAQFRLAMEGSAGHQLAGVRSSWFDAEGTLLLTSNGAGLDLPPPALAVQTAAPVAGVVWSEHGAILRVVRPIAPGGTAQPLGWLQLSRPADMIATDAIAGRAAVDFSFVPAPVQRPAAAGNDLGGCERSVDGSGRDAFLVTMPAMEGSAAVAARITVQRDLLAAAQSSVMATALALIVTAAVILAALGAILHGQLVQPLQRLTRWAERLPELRRHIADPPALQREDEIGQLARSLNFAAQTLTLQRDRLADNAARMTAARDSALGLSKAKTMFLADMSHELRTPLNAIIGFSEVIRNASFGTDALPRYREYAGDIHASGEHLLAVIDMVLDLARSDVATLTLYEEEVALDRAVALAVRLVSPMAERAGVRLLPPPAGLPMLRLDPVRLRQMLLNLLANAIKFTRPGGTVEVLWQDTPAGLSLGIADTGVGIAATDIARVLEPFGRVEKAVQQGHGGAGLGLPLTKALIERHGGALRLVSTVGAGTTVWLDIPHERLVTPVAPAVTVDAADLQAAE